MCVTIVRFVLTDYDAGKGGSVSMYLTNTNSANSSKLSVKVSNQPHVSDLKINILKSPSESFIHSREGVSFRRKSHEKGSPFIFPVSGPDSVPSAPRRFAIA